MVDYSDKGFFGTVARSETLLEHMINTVNGEVEVLLWLSLVFNY